MYLNDQRYNACEHDNEGEQITIRHVHKHHPFRKTFRTDGKLSFPVARLKILCCHGTPPAADQRGRRHKLVEFDPFIPYG